MTKYIVGGFFFLFCLAGCKSKKVFLAQDNENKTVFVTQILRDTILKIEKDNSYYQALLECQNNKVVLKKQEKIQQGKIVHAPKVTLKNNVLAVDCEARAQELFVQWKEKHKIENTVITKYIEVEKNLSFWQELQIWCGRLFILFIGIGYLLNYKGKRS